MGGSWQPIASTPFASEEGFSSGLTLTRPGTFLQAYDPSTAPVGTLSPSAGPASEPSTAPVDAASPPTRPASNAEDLAPQLLRGGLLLASGAVGGAVVLLRRRSRRAGAIPTASDGTA